MPYGVDYAPLTNIVRAGTVRNGIWQKWDDVTDSAVIAVAQWLVANWPDGLAITDWRGNEWQIKALPPLESEDQK